ncbi:MAG: cytochrome P450 [Acidimicrobiales bacterium]|jgi:cytochrome P450
MSEFNPFTPKAIADPYPNYQALADRGPLVWSDKLTTWILTRHSDCLDFFRHEHLSADRMTATKFRGDPVKTTARHLATDPPQHTIVRQLLTLTMSPAVATAAERLPAYIDTLLDTAVQTAAAQLLDRTDNATIDLVDDFAYPLPITVIAWMFNIPEADHARFGEWAHDLARVQDRFYRGRDADMKARLEEYRSYIDDLVASRRSNPGDDLVSLLLAADHGGDQLTDAEVSVMCNTLIFAGHETTVNLICNGVNALLQNPEQLERLRSDPSLMPTATEEFLRYDSPAQMISRTATADFEWHGCDITKGDSVVALLGAAHRDGDVFSDPNTLDIGRAPNPHLAFGAGIHFCPGAQLTRQESRAAIPVLLERFPNLAFADTPPKRRDTAVLRGFKQFPLVAR